MQHLTSLSDTEVVSKAPGSRPAAFAFVTDAESEAVLHVAVPDLTPNETIRGNIARAIRHLTDARSPNLLIVDISDVTMPISEVHKLADVCEPGVSVIVIGARNDVGLYRDLMQAGVADYLVKPLTPILVANAVKAATGSVEAVPMGRKLGKLIGFIGARGGVGASTLAVNLAWYLANQQSRRVALIDLDMHNGVCSLMLNVKASSGLRDALENPSRIDTLFLERTMVAVDDRLFLLGSEEALDQELPLPPEGIQTLVDILREQFHYVIVDVPRLASAPQRRVLEIADSRVIVIDQTLHAVRDAVRLQKLFAQRERERHDLIVINRKGESGRRAPAIAEITAALELPSHHIVPFLPTIFATAMAQGVVPVARRGQFANAIAALANEISGRRSPKRRWWGGLR